MSFLTPQRASLIFDLAINLFMEGQKMMVLYQKARLEGRDISDAELNEVVADNDNVLHRVEAALEVAREE